MTDKKKDLYIRNEETGEWVPLNQIGDIHAEQLTLDLDDAAQAFDEFDIDFSGTIDIDKEYLLKLLDDGWVVDPDDVRQELIECLDEIHNTTLNGVYHVAHADCIEEVKRADTVVQNELNKLFEKINTLEEIYFKSCYNEYKIERDDAKNALEPEKLN